MKSCLGPLGATQIQAKLLGIYAQAEHIFSGGESFSGVLEMTQNQAECLVLGGSQGPQTSSLPREEVLFLGSKLQALSLVLDVSQGPRKALYPP